MSEPRAAQSSARTKTRGPDSSREPSLRGAFAPDGIDLTAIHWMLERTPTERLLAAQDLAASALALRRDRRP